MPPQKAPKVKTQLMGADKLRQTMTTLSVLTKARAVATINRYSFELANEAKKGAPVDMGQLRAQIRPSFYNNGLVAEVGTNCGYGAFVEFGTGPLGRSTYPGPLPPDYVHGGRGGFPPLKRIKAWCKRVGIPEKFAFVIARRISRNGLKARPFMWPAFKLVEPRFNAEIRKVVPFGGF